ncbi:MAG: sodium-independent anion transporter, partial [Clostridia bacterium]|nr:sodium-independent anion transporter [Clostridia bacterium]
MNMFRPILFTELKTYNKSRFVKDLISGIIVAIIALPLSIALALASGVGPEEGLYTAIVAGFIISALGGCNVQIAGPTAAFATIVAGVIAKAGMNGLILATITAGVILILMGVLRLGKLVNHIPKVVTVGFTTGIAFSILTGQLKDFFGITYQNGEKR